MALSASLSGQDSNEMAFSFYSGALTSSPPEVGPLMWQKFHLCVISLLLVRSGIELL